MDYQNFQIIPSGQATITTPDGSVVIPNFVTTCDVCDSQNGALIDSYVGDFPCMLSLLTGNNGQDVVDFVRMASQWIINRDQIG